LHQEFQPLDNRKFGLNAENGKTSLQRVQRRPVGGGYGLTQQNDTPRSLTV
jgi:hypothetical protein